MVKTGYEYDAEGDDQANALGKQHGIPVTLPVENSFRQSDCNATVMQLIQVSGETATYQGVCAYRHQYSQQIKLSELRNEVQQHVETEDFRINEEGKLQIGDGEGFEAEELESY